MLDIYEASDILNALAAVSASRQMLEREAVKTSPARVKVIEWSVRLKQANAWLEKAVRKATEGTNEQDG